VSSIGEGQAPPVAVEVRRGGTPESVHRAHIAVVGPDGTLLAYAGDPEVTVLPRSTLKPLLSTGMVALGLHLESPELLAVASSSHSGEEFHVEAVQAILAAADLTEEHLANTPDWPFETTVREEYIADGGVKSRVRANCSGKHAAMLTLCTQQGWPLEGYLAAAHPLQMALAKAVSELVGEDLPPPAVDGCGAPVWALPLSALARGFAQLAAADADSPAGQVAAAMRAHPQFVGGSHRDVTELMRAVPGLVAKDGAEAMYCAGLPDGRGVAIKIEDGGGRARPAVIAGTLSELGFEGLAEIATWEGVLGGGMPAGEVVSRVSLTRV
jgi:L-asparaginase II